MLRYCVAVAAAASTAVGIRNKKCCGAEMAMASGMAALGGVAHRAAKCVALQPRAAAESPAYLFYRTITQHPRYNGIGGLLAAASQPASSAALISSTFLA